MENTTQALQAMTAEQTAEHVEFFDHLAKQEGTAVVASLIATGIAAYRDKMDGVFRERSYAAQNALYSSQMMAYLRTR